MSIDRLRATSLKYVKGIGPRRADSLLKELNLESAYDLLYHFPSHYLDRSRIYSIRDFHGEMPTVQVRGQFLSFTTAGEGAKQRLVGLFSDGTATMEVVWFRRIKWIREAYRTRTTYILFGRPTNFNGHWNMVHPEIDDPAAAVAAAPLRGVYPLTEKLRARGITSRAIYNMVSSVLALSAFARIAEPLPEAMVSRLGLMSKPEALREVHCPTSQERLTRARNRLKFEELFFLQLNILRYARSRNSAISGHRFSRVGTYFRSFYDRYLPFPLTGAQMRVIKEIRADMNTGRQMNRLLQGDVGSGKTLVALMTMLIALDNGCQACLLAPTEILASQHFETLNALAAPAGINIKLLTGSTPRKQRDIIHSQLLDGSLHILVGTHAIIEDNVRFASLGLAVIDEQHRFGVAQRAKMWQKNTIPPHVLVMTATPIPRTLAMTLYGDLEVSVIDELPPGRKPVNTYLRYDKDRLDVYRHISRQIRQGRQAYIVYPLIKENEKLDLRSLEEGYENICDTFPQFRIAYVHGRMHPSEKDTQMQLFASGKAQILVATTVIEVGVNVPNATTMVIENAERFGLSQLHQLRGRVGRGADQSYCILITKAAIARDTRERLSIMTSTTDGFKVAEADLRMRGPGDLEGTTQSGLPIDLHIASLASDGPLLSLARQAASLVLDNDPQLADPANQPLLHELNALFDKTVNWGMIS